MPRADRSATSRARWLVLAVPLLLIAAMGAWYVGSRQADGEVRAVQARAIVCTGATVTHGSPVHGGPTMDVIHARPGMTCTLAVTYENQGPVSVRLSTVAFDILGPAAEALAHLSGPVMHDHSLGDLIPATVQTDLGLGSGRSRTIDYRLVFNPHGCSDSELWVGGQPRMTVSTFGVTRTIDGSVSFAIAGTYDGCEPGP